MFDTRDDRIYCHDPRKLGTLKFKLSRTASHASGSGTKGPSVITDGPLSGTASDEWFFVTHHQGHRSIKTSTNVFSYPHWMNCRNCPLLAQSY
jgi:hypothetical protein